MNRGILALILLWLLLLGILLVTTAAPIITQPATEISCPAALTPAQLRPGHLVAICDGDWWRVGQAYEVVAVFAPLVIVRDPRYPERAPIVLSLAGPISLMRVTPAYFAALDAPAKEHR